MIVYFAYGSNMSRSLMSMRCPAATALGIATLRGWRFFVNPDGYGSIARRPGGIVRGVLWRLTLRDLAAVHAYESLDSGLYLRGAVTLRHGGCCVRAFTYIARRKGNGRPRPGYITAVVDAAREWEMPAAYIHALQRWSPSAWRGARMKETGELA